MKTFFVEQATKTNIMKSITKGIEVREHKIIINKNIAKINFSTKMKLVDKIKRYVVKNKIKNIVLEKRLKEQIDFVNLLYSNNINICNKSWLFKRRVKEVLQNVLKEKACIAEETDLYMCVNDVDSIIEDYIFDFAKNFKRLTIITNHIGKFKNMENKLYEEDGVLINVTNNKKKSLLKAKFVVNFDFPKELLNEFNIFDECVIINVEGDMKIRKKRFCGKIINDFEIDTDDELIKIIQEYNLQNYDIKEVCQAFSKS